MVCCLKFVEESHFLYFYSTDCLNIQHAYKPTVYITHIQQILDLRVNYIEHHVRSNNQLVNNHDISL